VVNFQAEKWSVFKRKKQELSKFIENQYLTNDEAKQKEEKEDRIGSQKLTRKVAYTSISISIIVSVISMIFNYLAYTTKREVIISNPKAFKDTISVYIINGKDSIQLNRKVLKINPSVNNILINEMLTPSICIPPIKLH
jgi:hypothetical protein